MNDIKPVGKAEFSLKIDNSSLSSQTVDSESSGSQFIAKDSFKQELGVSIQDDILELNLKNKITIDDSTQSKSPLSQALKKINFLKSKTTNTELPLENDFLKSFNELLKLNGGELKLYKTADDSELALSIKYPLH